MKLTIWLHCAVAYAASPDPHMIIDGKGEKVQAANKDDTMREDVVGAFQIPRQAEAEAPPEDLGWLSTW